NSDTPVSNFEEISFASDGHTEYILTTKSKIHDSKNRIMGVLGIGRDISDMKEKELQILKQKEELQTIFDTAKDGLAVIDLETNFLKVNKAYCDITGLSEEELLQTSCFALSANEDEERAHKILQVFMEKGTVDNFEKTCIANGKRISVELSASWMPNKTTILLGMKDISKNKLFEEQSKLASMGEMIGNIAHQWRQPLTVITTIASGIQVRNEFGQLEGYNLDGAMEDVMKQANYLSKTIDDFRNFIKDQHEERILSIKNTLEKTISILHSAMKNYNINLIVDLTDDIQIEGYENELMQSFINIINNSRDAVNDNVREDDDKLIFITTSREDNKLTVSIKDSGGGIPEEVIHKIFEPYFTTKHKSVGTGIGLSMTYKMVTGHHNATIEVFNEEYMYNNKHYTGACFEIVFEGK
ncbi:MAG: PAS domain-containing sensor histidine kinase, partial [Arcobacter sp.]|nr:PAS domain-containing sensor histidine kinase [Arcobacter sp.]